MDDMPFVRELCIALEHRWNPEELFLLFTSYFDEADTHGKAPTIIMSALLGHARQWELFERKLRRLQKDEQFAIFHGKEIRSYSGRFKGWNETRGRKVVGGLTKIIKDQLEEGILFHLEHEVYLQQYRNSPTP